MEFPSGSRLRRSPPPPPGGGARLPLSSDRISALSDDMILLILSRLGSVRAAARTGLLSQRWRRIWTQLADLAFCADLADNIQAALARFSASPAISSIQVRSPVTRDPISLMRAAALLSPAELVFVLKEEFRLPGCSTNLVLPCFHRATRMELDVGLLSISPPLAAGEFAALEKLSLAGHIPDLGTLLSRCPRLRVLGVTFRGVRYLGSLEAALDVLESAGLTLSFLGVETRSLTYALKATQFTPLLHAMGRLSPRKLVFTDDFGDCMEAADLPCFHRATSIEMNLRGVRFATLSDGMFSALERFSLSRGCNIIVDLDTFVSRCPRLRVLKVTVATGDITVHSTSLQDLEVTGKNVECHRIDIAAPMLKQLGLTVEAGCGTELSVSILTPMVEKVSWKRWYTTASLMFGFWHLECARLESTHDEDMCPQLPRVHALCLHISPVAKGRMGSRPNFEKEMEKLLITDFSVLDLRLHTCGHVFGALVLRILRTHQIRAATEKLKIVLLESPLDKQGWTIICPCADLKRQACPKSCPCTNPKNWRAQSISLPRLEEVEIEGFNGEHHEHAFLGFISKCSPMLKRVTLKLPSGFGGSTAEIYNTFLAYPSVKCYVYSCLGELVPQASCQHAP